MERIDPTRLVVDPFAGGGDLLKSFPNTLGYDVDASLNWTQNDSLSGIPAHPGALCLTNPPYLAKNSAVRRKLHDAVSYFDGNSYVDLYELALEKCLAAFDEVIAIIPETFLTTKLFKERLIFVDVLEDNPFQDTECPVLVACWGKEKTDDFIVYKNGEKIGVWREMEKHLAFNAPAIKMTFNSVEGNVGLIGIDGTGSLNRIRFCDAWEIGEDEIKPTSRARTRIAVESRFEPVQLIAEANAVLEEVRNATKDTVLSPFKNNNKEGERRRRLDFATARGILCEAERRLVEATGEEELFVFSSNG